MRHASLPDYRPGPEPLVPLEALHLTTDHLDELALRVAVLPTVVSPAQRERLSILAAELNRRARQ